MDIILKKDLEITNYAIDGMKKYQDIFIYGNTDLNDYQRAGTISSKSTNNCQASLLTFVRYIPS